MYHAQCPIKLLLPRHHQENIFLLLLFTCEVMVMMMPSSDFKWKVGIGSGRNELNKAAQLWAHRFPLSALPSSTPLEVIS